MSLSEHPAVVPTTDRTVLLVGATGQLGGLIANALLRHGARLNLLVRPGSEHKLPASLREQATLFNELAPAVRGASSVVSAVQGGPETIIDTQLELLRAARDAGVRRFIPSDFSYNLFGLDEGDNIHSDWRRTFARRADAEKGGVEVVHVMNGAFLDIGVLYGFLGAFDLQRGEAYLWGDGRAPMQFTTYADTAAYTAQAALAEEPLPGHFFVAGETLDFHGLVAATEAGLGRPIVVRQMGSLTDLDAEILARRRAEPANPLAWLPLMYWRGMLSGKGALGPLQNARFPGIVPTSVREYVSGIAGRSA